MHAGRLAKPVVLVALLTFALAAPARAADYWVKNGGSNALDGLSPANAWATLQHAADLVDPGDTVHVLDGSYDGFYLERSGTAGNPITFVADGPAVLITADNDTTPDGINLEGASYVVIDGFVVNDRTRAGIRAVLGEFVTVRNCRTGNNGVWGIFTGFVDDFTAELNETHDSVDEHGIYVSNSGDRPVLRGNVSYGNRGNGIHMNGDDSQGGDGLISEALVENNVIYDNGLGGGSGINMDGVTDSVVRNNLLYDNHASGISLYRIDGAAGSTHNLVVNNTIVQASDGRWCVNISGGSTGNTIRNNILYNFHSFRGSISVDAASRPGLVSNHNAIMDRFSINGGGSVITLAAWQGLGYDANSFLTTPAALFVAPASDFHLKPGSPAVNTGTLTDAPPTDLEGNPRPAGPGVDIGAYEQQLENCGDGTADPGEQCGEPTLSCADPCTTCNTCTCVPIAPVCGDALVCGAEECEGDDDCPAGETCNGCACGLACPASPMAGCRTPFESGKSLLVLKNRSPESRDQLTWKWAKGRQTPKTDFGSPLASTDYELCLYDGTGLVMTASAPAGGICKNGKPCWKDQKKGYLYKDSDLTPDGLQQIKLSEGLEDGKAKIAVKGKGEPLDVPDLDDLTSPLTVQLLRTGGMCWEAVYSAPFLQQQPEQLKDKAD